MISRRNVGTVHVDSGQILILDPVRMTDWQYNAVVDAPRDRGAAEVWLEEVTTIEDAFADEVRRTNDGVVIETGGDGSFTVEVEYDERSQPSAVRIRLT